MRRRLCVLLCVLVCVSACGSDGPSAAEKERTLRMVLVSSGFQRDHPGADAAKLAAVAEGTCEQFDLNPRWQQTLEFVMDPRDERGPVPDDGRIEMLVVQVYCPEHLAAAIQAVRDLQG